MLSQSPSSAKNHHIVIRKAENQEEIEKANLLIYETYVREGFWQDDPDALNHDKSIQNPNRSVFVVLKDNRIVGTASIITDSKEGLPADSFQPHIMKKQRASKFALGQVTSLAFDKTTSNQSRLVLLLFKYLIHFSFYYLCLDRVIALCSPKHAHFYRSVLLFQRLGSPSYYAYAKAVGQLLALDLLTLEEELHEHYRPRSDQKKDFYHFLLLEECPFFKFPDDASLRRPPYSLIQTNHLKERRIAV